MCDSPIAHISVCVCVSSLRIKVDDSEEDERGVCYRNAGHLLQVYLVLLEVNTGRFHVGHSLALDKLFSS